MPGPPIRKPSDHSPPAGSPRNIAGHHVLHRPLMPRHPPNAQNNKQQRHTNKIKKQSCRRNHYSKMLASTIQFTTNPPTPTHNPRQPGAPDGSGNQGALPQNPDSMPPPHAPSTQRHPPPADHHNHKAAAAHHSGRVSYTKHHNQPTPHSETSRPRLPCDSPSRPAQTHTAQTTTTRRPPTHNYLSLERR